MHVAHCRCWGLLLANTLPPSAIVIPKEVGCEALETAVIRTLRLCHRVDARCRSGAGHERKQRVWSRAFLLVLHVPANRLRQRTPALRAGRRLHVLPRRAQVTVINHSRAPARKKRSRNCVGWAAGVTLAVLLGVVTTARLRASEKAPISNAIDATLELALGAPTGVLAVLNPVNCSLSATDAAALNALAAVPGVRVTVLLLSVSAHDSVLQRVRADFSFSSNVSLQSAARVNPSQLPVAFRQPFVAVIKRGQLRHAAWGEAIKSLSSWLPAVAGIRVTQPLTPADSST